MFTVPVLQCVVLKSMIYCFHLCLQLRGVGRILVVFLGSCKRQGVCACHIFCDARVISGTTYEAHTQKKILFKMLLILILQPHKWLQG